MFEKWKDEWKRWGENMSEVGVHNRGQHDIRLDGQSRTSFQNLYSKLILRIMQFIVMTMRNQFGELHK